MYINISQPLKKNKTQIIVRYCKNVNATAKMLIIVRNCKSVLILCKELRYKTNFML